MHKFKRLYLNFLLATIVSGAFLFVGCSSDEDPADANIDVALLLGSWQNVQACPYTNDGITFLAENQFFFRNCR